MKLLYWYPNRPLLIPPDPLDPLNPKPDYLNSLEASGKYVAEQKWNGDNCLLYTDDLTFWNRHHKQLKYVPSPQVLKEVRMFPRGCIVNLELVHNKTITIKHKLVVHSLLAYKGKPLLGKTWGDARHLLETEFQFGEQVILSPLWRTGFWELFQAADGKTIEGIILKNPSGRLVFSTTALDHVSYMMKVRKPAINAAGQTTKYSF